ncbi:MAG: Hsp20/alpha crystallin family protein [Hydrogeniiclostridium sp.]
MFDLMPFDRRDNDMFSYFDSLGRSLFNSFGDNFFSAFGGTDIVDNGTSYELTADLPGFKKEEISVDINGDRLIISAEHKEDTNGDEKNYIHRERRYGTLRRSFDINGIQADQISARYTDGVLHLTLPKQAEEVPASHRIEIH